MVGETRYHPAKKISMLAILKHTHPSQHIIRRHSSGNLRIPAGLNCRHCRGVFIICHHGEQPFFFFFLTLDAYFLRKGIHGNDGRIHGEHVRACVYRPYFVAACFLWEIPILALFVLGFRGT